MVLAAECKTHHPHQQSRNEPHQLMTWPRHLIADLVDSVVSHLRCGLIKDPHFPEGIYDARHRVLVF